MGRSGSGTPGEFHRTGVRHADATIELQKLYVLDWEDSAEWYVPMKTKLNEQEISDPIAKRLLDNDLEREAKLEVVKERRKSLKSLVRYNLVQGRIARAIPGTR